MSRHSRWLSEQVDRWIADGIVTREQAARIRALYPVPATAAPWGLIVFSGIGAIIVGLGVILLLAYNWEAVPRHAKLAIVLGATGAMHATGLILRQRSDWQAQLGEVLSLLGTMLFGAGIWLVAQIYHIHEHYPDGYLYWGLGALAMAWALPSIPQGLVAVVTLTIWGGSDVWGFGMAADVSSLLLAGGLGILAWRLRSALLMAATVIGMHITICAHAGLWGSASAVFVADMSLSALLLALGILIKTRPGFERVAATLRFIGTAGFVVFLYVLTFEDPAEALLDKTASHAPLPVLAAIYKWCLFLFAALTWGWLARLLRAGRRELVSLDQWLIPVALFFCQAFVLIGAEDFTGLAVIVFNLSGFFLAAMWMVHGCREGHAGRTIAGSLLLSAIVLARFFDLFDSLALRGLAFIVLGAVLFAEGLYYRKLRRESDREATP